MWTNLRDIVRLSPGSEPEYVDKSLDELWSTSMDSPWITFDVDLNRMSPAFWMELGEARSKCDHLARVPMPPSYARELHEINLSKGVHATTAIEGNTLSEEEVIAILRRRSTSPAADYRVREVENVVAAYNSVLGLLGAGEAPQLTPELVRQFNCQVLEGLELLPEVRPGETRHHSVTVGAYRAPDWERCDELVQQMCDWLDGPSFSGDGTMRIPVAIIKASLAHLYLAWIHPFGDGNGRTARLCEFLVLVTCGVPTSAAHLISNHCNKTRDEYYKQLQYASESGGDVTRFLSYCSSGFVEGLGEQLRWIYDRQFRLTWHEYVGSQVTGRDPDMRERRALIAEVLLFREPVAKKDIPRLTPELAEIYAASGPKTLARDLNELVSIGLLRAVDGRYQADSDALMSLLPLSVSPDGGTRSTNPPVR
jgi:Fic family protein